MTQTKEVKVIENIIPQTQEGGAIVVKNKGGRPTKYNDDILKKSQEYIDSCIDEYQDITESVNEKTGRERFSQKLKVKLPKAEGLALYLEVSRVTLYEWAKHYKDFSNILEKINQLQADRVIDESLAGNYNPLISKLLLGKHGYKDMTDYTSDGKELKALTKTDVQHKLKAIQQIEKRTIIVSEE